MPLALRIEISSDEALTAAQYRTHSDSCRARTLAAAGLLQAAFDLLAHHQWLVETTAGRALWDAVQEFLAAGE